MKKISAIIIALVIVLSLTACGSSTAPSASPDDNEASAQSKPTVPFLTPDDVYAMTSDEVKTMRDDLFGRTFDSLSPEEQYNAVMLDYYLDWSDVAVKPKLAYESDRPVVGLDFTPRYYPLNQPIQEDLNGDGRKEEITVTASETGEMNGVILKINDLEIDGLYSGENLVNGFALIDINREDNFKEIVISDIGSSGDDTSKFYAFDGEKIIYMNEGANATCPMPEEAKTGSDPDEIGGLYTYIYNGLNGEITTLQRANILQTWWFPLRYELVEGHFLRAVPEIFKVHYDVFALRDMLLYKNQSDQNPTIPMEKGTIVTFTALDNIEWVQVRLSDGQKGWFKVTGFESLTINGEEMEAGQVFFNLYQAD